MDRIIEKLEAVVEKQIAEFESNPVKTSIKFLIFVWILKTLWKHIKQ